MQNEKFFERFGEVKISDELMRQVLPYIENDTLVIVNEYIGVVVTERSEEGAGIGYWDQVRVFFHDQRVMQEWNWRHKNHQHLDQKHLAVSRIGDIKISKGDCRIILDIQLISGYGSRYENFDFRTDNFKPPFENGEVKAVVVRPTEKYARAKIDSNLEYAHDMEKAERIAKSSGLVLTQVDYKKVIENNLKIGLMTYLKEAQKLAKKYGLELSREDYKRFLFKNLDRSGHPEDARAKDIKAVGSLAKFRKNDFQDIVKFCAENRVSSYVCYTSDDYGLMIAQEIVAYAKLGKAYLKIIARAYMERRIYDIPWEMSKKHGFKFTRLEHRKLIDGFLTEANEGLRNPKISLTKAKEVASAAGIKITEEEYKTFLLVCIKMMFRYEKRPSSFEDFPVAKKEVVQEVATIAGIVLEDSLL
jgi:hypothetical protein